jgi:hypothetical protein
MSGILLARNRHGRAQAEQRRLLYRSYRPNGLTSPEWNETWVALQERSTHNIIDIDGMNLTVETAAVSLRICQDVVDEITAEDNWRYWRRYIINASWESRLHLNLHCSGFTPQTDFKDFVNLACPIPCYRFGGLTLLSFSTLLFPTTSKAVEEISALFGKSILFWNACIDFLMFRNGRDHVQAHSDDSQGEEDVVSVIVQCEHDRVVKFMPIDPMSTLPVFKLLLKTGDLYRMNGNLQKVYKHSVEPVVGQEVDSRIVMILRHGILATAENDSGYPIENFEPLDLMWQYSTYNHPNLQEGKSYRFMQMKDLNVFK